tara:strand:- start:63 stop:410 length:348 start_codon:yes stop_codon:yes gene_type:complete
MTVGGCIKAIAFSVEGIGGGRDFAFASAFIELKRFIYMIDLQCGRLNYNCGGSALGSIELVWGGNNSFGRALLPNTFSWSIKTMPEIPNFPKWIGWYYLVGYAFIISVVAAITYL